MPTVIYFARKINFTIEIVLLPLAIHFLGSGPDRGQSPVEWGDFPFVRLSVRPSVRPFPPLGHPAKPEAQPARPEA